MGEVIKKYKKLPCGMEIELNAPQEKNQDFIIHIQNENGRLSLTRTEFIQLAILFFDLNKYKK